jgi:hypothetical protein
MKKIVFLHHSTGRCIWIGETNELAVKLGRKGAVQKFFDDYNRTNNTDYKITSMIFPKKEPYGWKNYPYDYYNIWIENAGDKEYMGEPTLEILTKDYDVIILKHCFPVSRMMEDSGTPDINSEERRLENYKLQYNALKTKMHSFPTTKFIVWTPAALVKAQTTPEQAGRANDFYRWLLDEWDEKDDNIYLWDFHDYETEGGLYLLEKYAAGTADSHPNKSFSEKLAPMFSRFIIDVIESSPGENTMKDGYQEYISTHSRADS